MISYSDRFISHFEASTADDRHRVRELLRNCLLSLAALPQREARILPGLLFMTMLEILGPPPGEDLKRWVFGDDVVDGEEHPERRGLRVVPRGR